MYHYVVHIDGDAPFINEVMKYGVHHCLEGGWQVSEAKEHYSWFVEPFIGDECCFPPVLLFNKDFIVSPINVKPGEEGASLELVN